MNLKLQIKKKYREKETLIKKLGTQVGSFKSVITVNNNIRWNFWSEKYNKDDDDDDDDYFQCQKFCGKLKLEPERFQTQNQNQNQNEIY